MVEEGFLCIFTYFICIYLTVISDSYCIVYNYSISVNNELEMMLKEAVVA
jgi:hypothetical protein